MCAVVTGPDSSRPSPPERSTGTVDLARLEEDVAGSAAVATCAAAADIDLLTTAILDSAAAAVARSPFLLPLLYAEAVLLVLTPLTGTVVECTPPGGSLTVLMGAVSSGAPATTKSKQRRRNMNA
eukprot:g10578.t1